MKKFLSAIIIALLFTMILPSCSQSDDFDDIIVNQTEEPGSQESGTDQDPRGGNERPGES